MEMKVNRELIKDLRIKKAWSQEKLADQAGISMRTIQRIETEGVASHQSRTAIADALEVDPADLLLESSTLAGGHESPTTFEDRLVDNNAIEQVWKSYIKPSLRFSVLALLWTGMVTTAFLIFTTLINGVFLWESTSMSFWQSAGEGLIGAAIFVPIFLIFHFVYKRLTRLKEVNMGT